MLLILTFVVLMLLGCTSIASITPAVSAGRTVSVPGKVESPNPAYALAQATIDYGKSQLLDLSRKATGVGLDMSQAANAAAMSTQDYNRRQKADLDYQSTLVSLNMAQAAATQSFIVQQTKMVRDATVAAQNIAAASTHSAEQLNITRTAQAQAILDAQAFQTVEVLAAMTAYPLTATSAAHVLNITETAQAQVILNVQATQSAQRMATLTAYPLTATPFAVTQAALLMQQYEREQKSFVDRVVAPLIPILVILVILLLILGMILAYRRFMLAPQLLHHRIGDGNSSPGPAIMIDAVLVDPVPQLPSALRPPNPPHLPVENIAHVEIVNASDLPIVHWIAEVENQLATKGDPSL